MSKTYLVRGGIHQTQQRNETFYLITSDFKNNHGYIGKRSENLWRLYTRIGAKGDKSTYYYHFPTFEECFEKLKQLSKVPIELIDNYFKEIETSIESDGEVHRGYPVIPSTDVPILNQLYNVNFKLTPGAGYKLELYLEALNDKPATFHPNVMNAVLFDIIIEKHNERLSQLKKQIEDEEIIIRPEDIPDLE